ncbi:MAG: hypothetical protein GKR86_08270 [Ilumatobacter sp.]|nr:hypothetical protein [Ilumatobacter sp.]
MHDQPQLFAYAYRPAHDLAVLQNVLPDELDSTFDVMQVLPFFVPSNGSGAAFDPVDHSSVDLRLVG